MYRSIICLTTVMLIAFSKILNANPELLHQASKSGRWEDVKRIFDENPGVNLDFAPKGDYSSRYYIARFRPDLLERFSINAPICDEESLLVSRDELARENCCSRVKCESCWPKLEMTPLVATVLGSLGYGAYEVAEKILSGETIAHSIASGISKPILYVMFPATALSCISCVRLPSRFFQHKVIGGGLGALGTIHGAAALVNKPHEIGSQRGITGAVMICSLGILVTSFFLEANSCVKRGNYYTRFLIPHLGAAMLFLSYAFHDANWSMAPYVGAALVLYIGGQILDGIRSYEVTATAWRVGGKVVVEINWPRVYKLKPGQYFKLKIGARYHPFSVALVSGEKISFVISPAGPATKDLFDSLENKNEIQLEHVMAQGPFGAGLRLRGGRISLVTYSMGSGCSPFIALINHLVERANERPVIEMHHSEREVASFEILLSEAQIARDEGVQVELHLYLTGEEQSEQEYPAWVILHQGRICPNGFQDRDDRQYFFCGSDQFVEVLQRVADRVKWDYEVVKFSF